MFGIDLLSVCVGIAVGATFPDFFSSLWEKFKTTTLYSKMTGLFTK